MHQRLAIGQTKEYSLSRRRDKFQLAWDKWTDSTVWLEGNSVKAICDRQDTLPKWFWIIETGEIVSRVKTKRWGRVVDHIFPLSSSFVILDDWVGMCDCYLVSMGKRMPHSSHLISISLERIEPSLKADANSWFNKIQRDNHCNHSSSSSDSTETRLYSVPRGKKLPFVSFYSSFLPMEWKQALTI